MLPLHPPPLRVLDVVASTSPSPAGSAGSSFSQACQGLVVVGRIASTIQSPLKPKSQRPDSQSPIDKDGVNSGSALGEISHQITSGEFSKGGHAVDPVGSLTSGDQWFDCVGQ